MNNGANPQKANDLNITTCDLVIMLRSSHPLFRRFFNLLNKVCLTKIQPFKGMIFNYLCRNAIGYEPGTLLWAKGIHSQKEDARLLKKQLISVYRLKKITEEIKAEIFSYLKRNEHCGPAVGVTILKMVTDVDFFNKPTEFPEYEELSEGEWNLKWDQLIKSCKAGDAFFTFDRTSIINKMIARADDGIWAHVGIVMNQSGEVFEMTPKGLLRRHISVYRHKKIRIGLYEIIKKKKQITEANLEEMYQEAKKQIWGYGYHTVLIEGFKRIFHIKEKKYNIFKATPNDLIRSGHYALKAYVW